MTNGRPATGQLVSVTAGQLVGRRPVNKKQATGYRRPEMLTPSDIACRLSPVACFPIDRFPADQLSGCHTG
jgi:hypothetical protein